LRGKYLQTPVFKKLQKPILHEFVLMCTDCQIETN
jgi:hypothetical protein